MRAVVQRVSRAGVTVDGTVVGSIGRGLCVLVGVTHGDDELTAAALATKVVNLRILDNQLSAVDLAAPLLVISQFTLYADMRRGRRPSWGQAAPADRAEPLVEAFVAAAGRFVPVETGVFGADMTVEIVNEGPMTLLLDSEGSPQ